MVQLYYGFGKGKTSAAAGAAVRAAGNGMRVGKNEKQNGKEYHDALSIG